MKNKFNKISYNSSALIFFLLMCFSTTLINAQTRAYEFTNDKQGWNLEKGCTITHNPSGYLDVKTNGSNDPYVRNAAKVALDFENINYIEISVKNQTSSNNGTILLISSSGNITVPINMTPMSNYFEELVIDLNAISGFSNDLVTDNIRLDPNAAGEEGTVSYDYIRFVTTSSSVINPTSVTINGPTSITTNVTAQFSTTFTPNNTTNKTVTYTVDDTDIATIDSSGLLSPKTAGTVTVTATTTDGSNISDTHVVTIAQGPNVIIGWEFNDDVEGWNTATRCSNAWNNSGYLEVTTTGDNDPIIFNENAQPFDAVAANYLELKVKNKTADTQGQLILFRGSGSPVTVSFPLTEAPTDPNDAVFKTIVVDLSTVNNWSSTDSFTDVRLDANMTGALGVISFDYIRFTNKQTLSTKSIELIDTTFLYPNPVRSGQDIFVSLDKFTSKDEIMLSLRDISGRLIYMEEFTGGSSKQISTKTINPGVYLVNITNKEISKHFKIIIN